MDKERAVRPEFTIMLPPVVGDMPYKVPNTSLRSYAPPVFHISMVLKVPHIVVIME